MNFNEKIHHIEDLLNLNRFDDIQAHLKEMHAADISDILIHFSSLDQQLQLFKLIPEESRGDVLIELDPAIMENLVSNMNKQDVSDIISEMDSDDATDLLSVLEEASIKEVLDLVDEEQKEDVLELLNYNEFSAGGIMGKEFVAVLETMTVNQIIENIRKINEEMDDIYNIWVTDKRNRLLGRISLKSLVLAQGSLIAFDIMEDDYHFVDVHKEQEEVARIFEKYNLVELPVVNDKHQIVGHILIDDIVDVIEEEAQEDISKLAGTGSEEIKELSFLKVVRYRLPWLIFALFAGMGAAFTVGNFQKSLEEMVQLSFFIPIVMAMGGNSGIQTSTIIIRGMALGEIDFYDLGHRLLKELIVSFLNGLATASLLFVLILLVWQDVYLGLVCSLSMILSMICAGMFGTFIPFILKKFNLDPALSSGPFITTMNDIIGIFIYFNIAGVFL